MSNLFLTKGKYMKLKHLLAAGLISASMINLNAEDKIDIHYSGYLDAYLAVENDMKPQADDAIDFSRGLTYINPKKNQLGLNMALFNISATYKNLRANFGLQHGDLVKSAYETPAVTNSPMLQQANVGINVFDKVWLDAGYFLTHIGGESFLPKDNWLSSHSLVTYYEPFYQAGLRASYEGEKLTAQLHILNGNGIIEENNHNKTFGLFLGYKILDNLSLSYANVMGNEEAGTPNHGKTHILHSICTQYDVSESFSIKAQLDLATKEKVMIQNKEEDASYMGVSAQMKYKFIENLSATFRFAMIDNKDGLYPSALEGNAMTLGVEYKPSASSYIRLEGSMYNMKDDYKVFYDADGKPTNSKMELMLNCGIYLD